MDVNSVPDIMEETVDVDMLENTDRNSCIIHCESTAEDIHQNLISPRDYDSWRTLLEAAQIRQFKCLLELACTVDENIIPQVFYHRKCRCLFTMKKELESLKLKTCNDDLQVCANIATTKLKRQKLSGPSAILEKKCIFCDKASKYLKKSNTREPLIICRELRADSKIRAYAEYTGDTRLLGLIGCHEMVAAEAHYHISCYKQCTIKPTREVNVSEVSVQEAASVKAFDFIVDYIRTQIFENPHIVALADSTQKYVAKLLQYGQTSRYDSAKKNLKRKLEQEFKNSLHFCQAANGRVLMYPDNLTMDSLVIEHFHLKQEMSRFREMSSDVSIMKAAAKVRSDIMDMPSPYSFPYMQDIDIDGQLDKLPESLLCLLNNIISGASTQPQGSVTRRVHAIGSDIAYSTTSGRIKMAKHLLLASGIKSLTGNVEIVHILNRLGHSISYSSMLETDTAIAMQRQESSNYLIPDCVNPYIFTTIAWDNIDKCEETLTGAGSTHRVNGIVIQKPLIGPRGFQREKNHCKDEAKKYFSFGLTTSNLCFCR